jgi:hypothetical protein
LLHRSCSGGRIAARGDAASDLFARSGDLSAERQQAAARRLLSRLARERRGTDNCEHCCRRPAPPRVSKLAPLLRCRSGAAHRVRAVIDS